MGDYYMTKKQKLELTWIGKDERPKLEPRILIEDPDLSYHANKCFSVNDVFDNVLIQGDNLLALRALKQDYTGKVKCIFIDPPYNTGNAFEHYDDGLEHSIWLSLFRDRIAELHKLLSEDGSIWISLDDTEVHYAKIICDEIFGRSNFIANVIWQKKHTRANDAKFLSDNHDHILCYAKNKTLWNRNLLPRDDNDDNNYPNIDNDPRGGWASGPCHVKTPNQKDIYPITTPSGRVVMPPPGTSWRFNEKKFSELIDINKIYFGKKGNNIPRYKRFRTEVQDGLVPLTIWPHIEVGHNQHAKSEVKAFNSLDVFATPKPENLIYRIILIASNSGDIILDSFGGSGTTGAVAHKMGRRWIMVEIGDHAKTHIVPRLVSVIDGRDNAGATETAGWKGGGGYRFYHLAPSLLKKDPYGNWVISKKYQANMLSAAICKLMGFVYCPSDKEYWNHGYSTESDFIFVTTNNMTHETLNKLSLEIGSSRTLLVCCMAFNTDTDFFDNLTLKKIPLAVMEKCEWGRDDYSFNVQNLLIIEDEEDIDLFSTLREN